MHHRLPGDAWGGLARSWCGAAGIPFSGEAGVLELLKAGSRDLVEPVDRLADREPVPGLDPPALEPAVCPGDFRDIGHAAPVFCRRIITWGSGKRKGQSDSAPSSSPSACHRGRSLCHRGRSGARRGRAVRDRRTPQTKRAPVSRRPSVPLAMPPAVLRARPAEAGITLSGIFTDAKRHPRNRRR